VCTQMPASLDSEEEAALLEQAGGRVSVFDFGGPLSFGAAADLGHHVRERARKDGTEALVLDFSRVPFLDVSAARAVETIAQDAAHARRKVFVCGANRDVRRVLSGLNADKDLPDNHIFDTREQALEAAYTAIQEALPKGRVSGAVPQHAA